MIGGYTAPQGDRDYFGALVLGVHEDGKLRWVGNVGTGFDQKMLSQHLRAAEAAGHRTSAPSAERPKPDRGMTWVKPGTGVPGEVRATGRRTENCALRCSWACATTCPARAKSCAKTPPGGAANCCRRSAKEATMTIDGRVAEVHQSQEAVLSRRWRDQARRAELLRRRGGPDSAASGRTGRFRLKRYPNGIKEEYFFQKHTPEAYPTWLRTELIDSDHAGAINYVFASDRASLLYLVNLGCIDHNPWMSRSGSLDNPDFVLIDLDPQECPFEMIVEAALMVKRVLDEIGLAGYPKTTGGDGMHVYIPVEPVYSYEETRTFAELISRVVTHEKPQMFTTPRSVSKRQKNRVYFDYLQNGKSKTIAAPYVLRAYEGAPVATPLEWSEVRPGLHPKQFTILNARERFPEKGDLFRGVLDEPQNLYDALARLEKLFK